MLLRGRIDLEVRRSYKEANMEYDRFIGHVQHRARLGTFEEAVKATRAALETLGRRLAGGAPGNLAAQLPTEIGRYLTEQEGTQESFSLDEFFERVANEEGVDLPKAVYHARVVIEVLREAVGDNTVNKARDQLPDEWRPLFDAGSEGKMPGGDTD
jgi:uncharacterized protein (DUF2267 family)